MLSNQELVDLLIIIDRSQFEYDQRKRFLGRAQLDPT